MQSNQTKQLIEMHKKYKTRDGHPVRILCVDCIGKNFAFPVIALVKNTEGEEHIEQYMPDGHYHKNHEDDLDLIEVQPWEDFKIDDPVLVSDDGECWYKRHFAGIGCNGRPTAFNDGATSFTTPIPTLITEWNYCKKPDQK